MRIFDLHNDFLTEKEDFKSELLSYGKTVYPVAVIYKGNRTFKETEDIARKYKRSGFPFKTAFEDVGYEDAEPEDIIKFNPLYASLTYNGENRYGFGADINEPLKKDGLNAAKKLNAAGVAVDVAHLSERGVYSLSDNGVKIINTHTAFSSVYKHKRNITNGVIEAIINCGGVIGMTLVGYFLGEKADIESVFSHVDYFAERFGTDNLCIGTDFNGTDYLPEGIRCYNDLKKIIFRLEKAGYNKGDINKIFYMNAERYFKNLL